MTIRVRLTVLYATAFFIAGAVLIALMYFYLDQSMDRRPGAGAQSLVKQFLAERGLREFPVAENLVSAFAAQAEQQREDIKRGMLTWSFVSLGVVGLAAGGFGWLLAGRALQPLHQITTTARRVADRSLHERIGLDGPDDEIKDLADTFDAMLERLDHAFDGQRRFVANASHELRTPLTINRTLIEVAIDDPDAPSRRAAWELRCWTSIAAMSASSTACWCWRAVSNSSPAACGSISPTSHAGWSPCRRPPRRRRASRSSRGSPLVYHRRSGSAGALGGEPDRQRDPVQPRRSRVGDRVGVER